MSSIIVVQGHDRLYMASDSATSVNINDKVYRYSDDAEKLFHIDDKVIFCSGNMLLSNEIIEELQNKKQFTVKDVQSIAIEKYRRYLNNKAIKKNEFVLDIVIGTLEENKSVVYQISPYNNFDIIKRTVEQNQLAIWTGGIKVEQAFKTMLYNLKSKKYIYNCYKETFSNLACEEIGGHLTVYKLKSNTIKKVIDKQKINEKRKIVKYTDEFNNQLLNLVVAERLYGQVIVGENLEIGDEEGTFLIKGNLLTVKDRNDIVRLLLGEYEDDKFGLKLFNKSGRNVILDEDGILQSWQEGRADNVDETHGLSLWVYIPEETLDIRMAKLRFKLLPFRSYSGTTESAPAQTRTSSSGGGTSTTSGSGGGVSTTSGSGGSTSKSTESGGVYSDTSAAGGEHRHVMFEDGTNVQGAVNLRRFVAANGGLAEFASDKSTLTTAGSSGTHTHRISIPPHTHGFSVPSHNHTITLNNHTHSITIPNHTHTVEIPSHSHPIVHDIYEASGRADGIGIIINGIERTLALGGKFYTDELNIDIGEYLAIGTYNEIILTSETLGRIDASIFVQMFVGTGD